MGCILNLVVSIQRPGRFICLSGSFFPVISAFGLRSRKSASACSDSAVCVNCRRVLRLRRPDRFAGRADFGRSAPRHGRNEVTRTSSALTGSTWVLSLATNPCTSVAVLFRFANAAFASAELASASMDEAAEVPP